MVGTDIIEVSRIEKLIKEKGDKFLNKIYTQDEIKYCESKGPNKYQHYAGRFAAKEAVFKVLNGKRVLGDSLIFKNIEILNKNDGAPYVNILDNTMVDCFDINIDISFTHGRSTGLEYTKMYLLSPNLTLLKFFDFQNAGKQLLNTTFDDEADDNFSDGSSPFIGSFKPLNISANTAASFMSFTN